MGFRKKGKGKKDSKKGKGKGKKSGKSNDAMPMGAPPGYQPMPGQGFGPPGQFPPGVMGGEPMDKPPKGKKGKKGKKSCACTHHNPISFISKEFSTFSYGN